MADKQPTPEEELLKLIERPGSDAKSSPAKPSATAVQKPKSGWQKKFESFFERKDTPKVETKTARAVKMPAVNFRQLNIILFAAVLAAAIYLVLDLVAFQQDKGEYLGMVSVSGPVYPVLQGEDAAGKKKLDYYLSPLESRNPFASRRETPEESAPKVVKFAAATEKSLIGPIIDNLNLVGIAWSDDPLAMIEDMGVGKTYFLRRGQTIRGAKIESIAEEKVVLTYEGEEGYLV